MTQRMHRTASWLHLLTWILAVVAALRLFAILIVVDGSDDGVMVLAEVLATVVLAAVFVLVLRAIALLLTNAAEQRPASLDETVRLPEGVDLSTHCSECGASVHPSASHCPACGARFDEDVTAQPAT
jgi:hypothetical protein